MNRILMSGAALIVLFVVAGDHTAWGQLFGQRDLGRPLVRRPTAGSAGSNSGRSGGQADSSRLFDEATFENVGALDENARYLRGNRDVTDFVGASTGEERRFVGSQLAETAAEIVSAVDELEIETAEDANVTAEPPVTERLPLNAPRLQLGFSPVSRLKADVASELASHLQDTLKLDDMQPIQVSVENDVVVLVGQVATARERKLAELLLRFEPGVNAIDNRLEVQPTSLLPEEVPLPPPPKLP